MKFVFASYVRTPQFDRPETWIERIRAYLGVLESLGKQHEVISIEQINYTGDYHHNNVQYHFMDFGKRKLYFPWRLHRFIKKQSPDVILVHGIDFPLQVIQLRLTMGRHVKIIVQSHGNKTPAGLKKIIQRIADKCIDAYFFTSKQMGENWVNQNLVANATKIHEIMVGSSVFHPMDQQTARSKNGADGSPFFLWVGNLDQNKDPLTVIKAFLRFAVSNPQAKLYMIYQSGELLPEIQSLLMNYDNREAVILVGKVAHADLLYWFNSADFFISGSHFEVFGAAVSEAMSCGCVPIVTDIPSFQQITGNGACGMRYKAGNEDALLTALHRTATMNIPHEQEKVNWQFEQHLSFDAIAQRIQEVAVSL